jgi:hypothetical protein
MERMRRRWPSSLRMEGVREGREKRSVESLEITGSSLGRKVPNFNLILRTQFGESREQHIMRYFTVEKCDPVRAITVKTNPSAYR